MRPLWPITLPTFRMNSQFEDSHRLPLDRASLHFFGMVHKCLCDCL